MIEHAISIPAEYSKAFQALLHLVEEYPRKVVIKVTGALSEPAVVTGTHHDTLLTIKGMESGKIGMFGVLPFLKALENNVALLLVCVVVVLPTISLPGTKSSVTWSTCLV